MKVEDEIRHMLRLAGDPGASQAERDTAARRAEYLMVKHRIESLPDETTGRSVNIRTITVEVKGGTSSMAPAVNRGLCALAQAMDCYAVYSQYRRHSNVTIAGDDSDLAWLMEIYNSVMKQYPLALKQELVGMSFWSDNDRYNFRRSYTLGFFYGVSDRIEEMTKKETQGTGKELVLADRRRLSEEEINRAFNSIRQSRRLTQDWEGLGSGRTDGYNSGIGQKRQKLQGTRKVIEA